MSIAVAVSRCTNNFIYKFFFTLIFSSSNEIDVRMEATEKDNI